MAINTGGKNRPRIGLAWSGNANHKNDLNRSLTLSELLPFLPSKFEYISLQKELRDTDKNFLEQHHSIKFVGNHIDDFSDTGALCECIDLVISVDTSVAHLAGTLNKQTWVLLPFVPDWRWLLDRDTSPWYPSIKIYRQENIHDWKSALQKVKFDLEKLTF